MLSTDNGEAAVAQPTGPKLLSLESFGDASFGLRQNALSPMETLAQSVSTIAPSTSPQLTIPLVFLLAAMQSSFDPREVWNRVRWADEEARHPEAGRQMTEVTL